MTADPAPVRDEVVGTAALSLLDAHDQRAAIKPLTETTPDLTLAESYAIQQAQIQERQHRGARIAGHKVGLTSVAMQRALGVAEPDYGHLLRDMFFAEHEEIPAGTFIQPRIEPELAFVLKRRLEGPGLTAADVARAIDFAVPALEIIDSRIADWRITLRDTIADNASSGGVVLGSTPYPVDGIDLRLTGCVLSLDGRVADTGAGGAVLGSPLRAVLWLANTLGEQGVALEEGHVVLSGSCTAALTIHPGSSVRAAFAGMGSVTANFAQGATS